MKHEASGFPGWCKTDKDKDKYIREYCEHQGTEIDEAKIVKNAVLRSLAKFVWWNVSMLWNQRQNQTKVVIILDSKTLFKMLTIPEIQVNRVQIINDEAVAVSYEYLLEVGDP